MVVELLGAGRDVLIIDNFSNSHPEAISRITELAPGNVELLERDLVNPAHKDDIISAVKDFGADSAIHLAGLKAVGESVAEPVRYYETNIGSALTLLSALEAADASTIVFSSSATVYGELKSKPG